MPKTLLCLACLLRSLMAPAIVLFSGVDILAAKDKNKGCDNDSLGPSKAHS